MQLIDAMYYDVPRVKISNYVVTSQSTHLVGLCLCKVAQSSDDIGLLDQTTPLDKNK